LSADVVLLSKWQYMSTGDQVILRRFVMMMFLLLYLLSTLWAKKLQPFYFCN